MGADAAAVDGRPSRSIGLIATGCIGFIPSLVLQPESIFQMTGLFSILSPGCARCGSSG
jgi:hypothetical protein